MSDSLNIFNTFSNVNAISFQGQHLDEIFDAESFRMTSSFKIEPHDCVSSNCECEMSLDVGKGSSKHPVKSSKLNTRGKVQGQVQQKSVECSFCSINFHWDSDFKNHVSINKLDPPEPCPLCGEKISMHCTFGTHLKSHHRSMTQCPGCSRIYSQPLYLHKHILEHKLKAPTNCRYGCRTFLLRCELDRHLEEHRTSFKCVGCSKTYLTTRFLDKHVSKNALETAKECPECKSEFTMECALTQHLMIHARDKKDQTPPHPPPPSPVAIEKSSSKSHLDCTFCEAKFNQEVDLQRHLLVHVMVRRCPGCNMMYSSKSSLDDHISKNRSDRGTKCPRCPKRFTMKCTLEKHKISHPKQKGHPLKCSTCQVIFVNSYVLKKHQEQCALGLPLSSR